MIVLRLSGNAVPGAVSLSRTRSSLCNSATSRSISSLILLLDFVLVFYCSTMISRHNRVGTLFFATAEFIFDDWHRFLRVLIGQPCWSAHCPLSALYTFGRNTTPLSVILYATLLDTSNFLLSIETTRSEEFVWIVRENYHSPYTLRIAVIDNKTFESYTI